MWSLTEFHVAPRYTPGADGVLPERMALEVAKAEAETYQVLLEAPELFPEQTERAREEGLARIVYSRREEGRYVEFTDILTGEALKAPRDIADSMWVRRMSLVTA